MVHLFDELNRASSSLQDYVRRAEKIPVYVVIRGKYCWCAVQAWLSSVAVYSDVVYPTFYAPELCYHGWYSSSFTLCKNDKIRREDFFDTLEEAEKCAAERNKEAQTSAFMKRKALAAEIKTLMDKQRKTKERIKEAQNELSRIDEDYKRQQKNK